MYVTLEGKAVTVGGEMLSESQNKIRSVQEESGRFTIHTCWIWSLPLQDNVMSWLVPTILGRGQSRASWVVMSAVDSHSHK